VRFSPGRNAASGISPFIAMNDITKHVLDTAKLHGEAILALDRRLGAAEVLAASIALASAERKLAKIKAGIDRRWGELLTIFLQAGGGFQLAKVLPSGTKLSREQRKIFDEITHEVTPPTSDFQRLHDVLKLMDSEIAIQEKFRVYAREVGQARAAFRAQAK
jgi:hypothetical protein